MLLLACSSFVVGLVHRYVFAVYVIEGWSMAPTLKDGDTALVNMLARQVGVLERGEIVLVRDGGNDYATKRIVGLPGERIEIKDGKVFVNDSLLPEYYLPKSTITRSQRTSFLVGDQQYFVLGDNRADSFDSRFYGPVSKSAIMGSYTRTFWAFR